MIRQSRLHWALELWLHIIFVFLILYALVLMIPVITHYPDRALWIDEIINFEKIWQVFPYWLTQYSLFELIYLVPLRWLPLELPTAIFLYRTVSLGAWLTTLIAVPWYLHRHQQRWDTSLLVVACLVSLLLFGGYALVARPYIIGLCGIVFLALDRWKGRWSYLGFALALFHTVTAVFAVITVLSFMRARRTTVICLGLVVIGYFPAALNWFGLTFPGFNLPDYFVMFKSEVAALDSGAPGSWLFVQGFRFTGDTALASIVISMFIGWLVAGFRRMYLWTPVLYLLALVLMRTMNVPVMSRFAAPAAIWSLVCLIHVTLPHVPNKWRLAAKMMPVLLIVPQLTDLQNLPITRHWETAPISLNASQQASLSHFGCHIHIDADTALSLTAGLSMLLQLNIWLPMQHPAAHVKSCDVSLAEPLAELYFANQSERYRRIFLPEGTPPESVPTIIIQPQLDQSAAMNYPDYNSRNYQATRVGPVAIYTRKIL